MDGYPWVMYGKSYESKYKGSMVGAGINVFAVWDYMTTMARDGYVEVNPDLLAFTLGGREQDPKEIQDALDYLMRPDPKSRSKDEDGRRILKEGQFQYRIVNWEEYNRIRTEEDRREYNRVKQAEWRARQDRKEDKKKGIKKSKGGLTFLPGEATSVRASEETGKIDMPHEFETGKNGVALDPNASRSVEPGEEGESDSGL